VVSSPPMHFPRPGSPEFYEVRSRVTMDMAVEKKVFDLFMSTLVMLEHTPSNQEVDIRLTLGELRQHVQWCQYAAIQVDGAEAVNQKFTKTRARLVHATNLVEQWKYQERVLQSLTGALNNASGQIAAFNKSRTVSTQELKEYAKTND
jgi:hypothetical protein